ncbi:hypothetical protein JTB14_025794 [Gonioctena quinquepunctata]|nr:hypothetical protein JTB14_025794 [Gonioctena quinquepunctata]
MQLAARENGMRGIEVQVMELRKNLGPHLSDKEYSEYRKELENTIAMIYDIDKRENAKRQITETIEIFEQKNLEAEAMEEKHVEQKKQSCTMEWVQGAEESKKIGSIKERAVKLPKKMSALDLDRSEVAYEDAKGDAKTQTENSEKHAVDKKRREKTGKVKKNLNIPTRASGKAEKKNSERKAVKGPLETGSPCSLMANRKGKMGTDTKMAAESITKASLEQTLVFGKWIYKQDVDRKTGVLQDLDETWEGPYMVIRSEPD